MFSLRGTKCTLIFALKVLAMNQAVSLRPLTADARFRCKSVHFKCAVDWVALGHIFLRVLGFSPVCIVLPMLHTRLHLYVAVTKKENGRNLGTFQDARLLRRAKRIKEKIIFPFLFFVFKDWRCRFQWPRGLRHGSLAARLLGLWVRIPPGTWMSVSCDCFVLSSRGLCVGLITRPEDFYRVWCVWVRSWILDNE